MTTTSQIFDSKISLFDSSFGMKDWETGQDYINLDNQWMSFDSGDKYFDVTFSISGTCSWYYERGDYGQPDFFEQNDIDIDIVLESSYSENLSLDINDGEVKTFLINLIKSNLN